MKPPVKPVVLSEMFASALLSTLDADNIDDWARGIIVALEIMERAGASTAEIGVDEVAACITVRARGRKR